MASQFDTPQDAEDAFYDSFEAHDLDGMMAVWDAADDIACVLPMSPVLQGRQAVQESWESIFRHPQPPEVEVHHRQWFESDGLAVHVVEEKVTFPGGPPVQPAMIASNVYRRIDRGWRLVVHQVSPPPPPSQAQLAP